MLIAYLLLALHVGAQVSSFRFLPFYATGISANGRIVVGSALTGKEAKPCVWTSPDGLSLLPLPQGWRSGSTAASSGDGRHVAGTVDQTKNGVFIRKVVVWDDRNGPRFIGIDSSTNGAVAMSSDGVVVGQSRGAFKWSNSFGISKLRPLKEGHEYGGASACSQRGEVVVGFTDVGPKLPRDQGVEWSGLRLEDGSIEACVWPDGRSPFGLGRPDGFFTTQATGVSSDGKVVCGFGGTKKGDRPFKWTAQLGFKKLPLPRDVTSVEAYGVSGDGRTIYGTADTEDALIWRDGLGVVRLQDHFKGLGVRIPAGWRIDMVAGVSYNARAWVGQAQDAKGNTRSWHVVLPDATPASRLKGKS